MLQSSNSLSCKYKLFIILYKSKVFDYLIKTVIPTPGCLLQSINGSLKFAYLVIILRVDSQTAFVTINVCFLFENPFVLDCCRCIVDITRIRVSSQRGERVGGIRQRE